MHRVNVRYIPRFASLPVYLLKGDNSNILNNSLPLNMDGKWFKDHVAYTISKYGISMCAEEFHDVGVAVNTLWPRTAIATTAVHIVWG